VDEIIDIKEEIGKVILNTKSGKKIPTMSKTIYTYYKSGRKDCTVQIQKPLDMFSKNLEIGG